MSEGTKTRGERPTADEAAFADWKSWLVPSLRAMVRTPTGAGDLVDPLQLAVVFAHRSAPLFAELRGADGTRLGPNHLASVMTRLDGARWLEGVPADQVACVVAVRDEEIAIGVTLASLFDKDEVAHA